MYQVSVYRTIGPLVCIFNQNYSEKKVLEYVINRL